jgi:ferredoxin
MKLTSEMIKARAKELGIDCIAIGNIERFKNAPKLMSPITYFPNAKSVIAVAMRIPRGTYRGIEEGTHWHNYTFYSYSRLNALFRPRKSYDLCRFIEDHGWEAVPHYPANSDSENIVREPVAEGKVPPNVTCSVRIIAAGCGLGEIGWSKVFLTKKFGPRVRLGLIFTDCELEPDPILDTGDICIHCGACQRECPGNAVPSIKDENSYINVDFGEKQVWYGDVHMGRCALTHQGFNNECSPFLKKDLPHMAFDVRNTEMSEEEAYMLVESISQFPWDEKPGDYKSVVDYYKYIRNHVGYYAMCGARGCIRACMNTLEKTNRIENKFHNEFYKKPSWLLPNKPTTLPKSVNPFRQEYLDEKYPGITEGEYRRKL